MSELMKRQFLSRCHEQADRLCQEHLTGFGERLETELADIAQTLLLPVEGGLRTYRFLEEKGEVGPLRYLYLSHLRSGVLCRMPVCRIDFYDGRGRMSLVECAERWEFSSLYRGLSDIRGCLEGLFASQTFVPGCELDAILLQKAELFFREAERSLPRVLSCFLERYGEELFSGKTVDILGGELLDHVKWMAGWDQDGPVGEREEEGRHEV